MGTTDAPARPWHGRQRIEPSHLGQVISTRQVCMPSALTRHPWCLGRPLPSGFPVCVCFNAVAVMTTAPGVSTPREVDRRHKTVDARQSHSPTGTLTSSGVCGPLDGRRRAPLTRIYPHGHFEKGPWRRPTGYSGPGPLTSLTPALGYRDHGCTYPH